MIGERPVEQNQAQVNNHEIILAPMEGVLDYPLRQVITALNRYDYCVSEFIRVSDVVFPARIFYQEVPELKTGGCTQSGTPVWVQLLGADPKLMAENAVMAVKCGALGIDLNFGCPSKFVHRSNGGAAVLKYPKLLGEIVQAVRDAIPSEIPVSAKIRLGWDDSAEAPEIFSRCLEGGANKVIIHARTKADGYRPGTIKWEAIAPLAVSTTIPVVANGDIVDGASADACRKISGCGSIMLGRFAIAIPNLERLIRVQEAKMAPADVLKHVLEFVDFIGVWANSHYQKARAKQFIGYIRMAYPELTGTFRAMCRSEDVAEIISVLSKAQADFAQGREPVFVASPPKTPSASPEN